MAQYESDSLLLPAEEPVLLSDHMELFIQFGFVVMFVGALPLLPLFALCNNVIELRIDATKILRKTQRILPSRTRDIRPWLKLLRLLSKVAVVTNAFILALDTSVPGLTLTLYDRQLVENKNNLPFHETHAAEYDRNFRFTSFWTPYWCFKYDPSNHVVDRSQLAEPLPPTLEEAWEGWGDPPDADEVNSYYQWYYKDTNMSINQYYMEQCRGGVMLVNGYVTNSGKLANRKDTSINWVTIKFCRVNHDFELKDDRVVTSARHYRLRYTQFAFATAFILLAAGCLLAMRYLLPKHTRYHLAFEQRREYLFRQLKQAIIDKNTVATTNAKNRPTRSDQDVNHTEAKPFLAEAESLDCSD